MLQTLQQRVIDTTGLDSFVLLKALTCKICKTKDCGTDMGQGVQYVCVPDDVTCIF